jgi:hypothetical protein
MFLVIIPVVSFVSFVPVALVLIAVVALRLVTGLGTRRPEIDVDEMAAKVVRKVAIRKIYKSEALVVVPVLGRPGMFHVVTRQGRRERIATAASLAVLHTLVIAHFAAQYA